MVRSVILYFLFPCLIIAFLLSFAGVTQVASGEGFKLWIKSVNDSYLDWSFQIPKIPKINQLDTYSNVKSIVRVNRVVTVPVVGGSGDGDIGIISWFKSLVNFLIMVANGFISVLNILITIINVLIQVIQFILTMVWCVKDIPTYASIGDTGESIWWYHNIH